MVAQTRSKARKEPKADTTQSATAISSQRSLKDMFGRSGQLREVDLPPTPQEVATEVVNSSSEIEVPPLAPETVQAEEATAMESEALSADVEVELTPPIQPVAPKKLFSIFERPIQAQKESNTAQQETDVIHLSDSDSCTEGPAPYQRESGQHLFSVSSSSRSKSSSNGVLRQGSSREVPIVVDGRLKLRPSRVASVSSSKPVYSIFATKQRLEDKNPATICRQSAPFPDKEEQHVYGTRTTFSRSPSYFPRSTKGKEPMKPAAEFEDSLKPIYPIMPTYATLYQRLHMDNESAPHLDTIPRAHRAVPAVARALQYKKESETGSGDDSSREKWTEKWRPIRAEHVLGNEAHALYLRDWLRALRLQGSEEPIPSSTRSTAASTGRKRKVARRKKPRIVRHVKKRKARGYDDAVYDFIASDESTDFEEPLTAPSSDFDELAFSDGVNQNTTDSSRGSSPLTPFSEEESPTPPSTLPPPRRFRRQLTNTILLSGPSGSGKTAAIYACAEELGYEVFEVYPGMGERNGASLQKFIGDVGKNHLVNVKRHRTPDVQSNFFQRVLSRQSRKALPRIPDSSDVESLADELDVISSEPDEPSTSGLDSSQPIINQSLILVEEVDILYQTDSNFWPALINIIKDCKRPVVLTCNDISLVPCQDLPLQEVLRFLPCESSLASSYLQAFCFAEDRPYPRQELARIYDSFDPNSSPLQDLRHAINYLQFHSTKIHSSPSFISEPELNHTPTSRHPGSPTLPDTEQSNLPESQQQAREKLLQTLRDMDRIRETQSFVDSHLSRETNIPLWNLFLDDTLPLVDNELGYTTVQTDRDLDHVPVSSYYDQDESVIASVLQCARQACPQPAYLDEPCSTDEASAIEFKRRQYLTTAGSILRSLSSLHVFASDAALHLDYASTVRNLVDMEQYHEEKDQDSHNGSQKRTTNNSRRTRAWGWLPLSDGERDILRATRLRLGDHVEPI